MRLRRTNIEFKYLGEIETELYKELRYESGIHMGSIYDQKKLEAENVVLLLISRHQYCLLHWERGWDAS